MISKSLNKKNSKNSSDKLNSSKNLSNKLKDSSNNISNTSSVKSEKYENSKKSDSIKSKKKEEEAKLRLDISKFKPNEEFVFVKKSGIHNTGVFAKKFIPKNTLVIEYVGEKISKEESERRADLAINASNKDKNNGAVYSLSLIRNLILTVMFLIIILGLLIMLVLLIVNPI